jgi:hypothetical protein
MNIRLIERPWIIYLVLFASVMWVSYCIFSWCNLFHTDPESARYMLSALVQSEAAIIAIVITLSLVAVQLTVSSYPRKIMGIFRENFNLWILMILYITIMIYTLVVLKMIRLENIRSSIEAHINLSLFLGIFCFSALPPYTYVMLHMLQPATIVEKLSQKIDKNTLFEEDTIFLIAKIILDSIKEHDPRTARDSMKTMGDRIRHILETEEFTEMEDSQVSKKIFDYIYKIYQTAVKMDDDDTATTIINIVADLSRTSKERNMAMATMRGISLLGQIGKIAAQRNQKKTTKAVIVHLIPLGLAAIDKRFLETAKIVIQDLGSITKTELKQCETSEQMDNESLWKADKVAVCLGEIVGIAEREGIPDVSTLANQTLEDIRMTTNV